MGAVDASEHIADADLNACIVWCRPQGLRAMPATREILAAYLTAHAGVLKVSTLTRGT